MPWASPNAVDLLGYAAASLTTLSFLPQALLTLRTRNVAGISLGMYGAFTAGVALWLVYGVLIGQWPIIVANALTLGLASVILGMKIAVERGRREQADQQL
ncbi:MAG: SemiSWEET transporter [Proteobacteria bacterium]|nr:SemiSWEET transporter [Pseudomonadota bacterium]